MQTLLMKLFQRKLSLVSVILQNFDLFYEKVIFDFVTAKDISVSQTPLIFLENNKPS